MVAYCLDVQMLENGSGYTAIYLLLMWVMVGCGPNKPDPNDADRPQGREMNDESKKGTSFAPPPEDVEPADTDIEVPPAP